MLLTLIRTYLELLIPVALIIWGVGMIIYGIVGGAIGIIRSIPVFTLVVFVLVFLFLVVTA